jgi:hypothetical protein
MSFAVQKCPKVPRLAYSYSPGGSYDTFWAHFVVHRPSQSVWYQRFPERSVQLYWRISDTKRLSCKCLQACLKENSLESENSTEDAVMLEADASEGDSRAIQPSSGE